MLNYISLSCYILINAWMMIYCLFISRERGYEFPFWAGAMAMVVVVPQAVAFYSIPDTLPPSGYAITLIFASLCSLFLWMGFIMGRRGAKEPPRILINQYSMDEMRRGAGIMILVGAVFYWYWNHLVQQEDFVRNTGIGTVVMFFAQILKIGFFIVLYQVIAYKDKKAMAWLGVCLFVMLPFILFKGRRNDMMQFGGGVLMIFWFVRRRALPRWLILLCVFLMFVFMCNTGYFRSAMSENNNIGMSYWERLSQISWLDGVDEMLSTGGAGEFANCVYAVSAVNETMQFDYGSQYWNWVVFSFVPAQFVGSNVKEALYIANGYAFEVLRNVFPYYEAIPGTMWLGYSDAFQSFGWFGSFLFGLVGWLMGRLYEFSKRQEPLAIISYVFLFSPAMHLIPANVMLVFIQIIYFCIFGGIFLVLTRGSRHKSLTT